MTTQRTTPINVTEAGDASVGTGAYDLVARDSAGKIPSEAFRAGANPSTSVPTASQVYQNTSGKYKLIIATSSCKASNGGQASSGTQVVYYCDSSATPTTVIGYHYNVGAYIDNTKRDTITFIVPPNYYYKYVISTIGPAGGLGSVENWYEIDLL